MATAVLISMRDIESSLLKQIGYDAETFTLSARFLPGKKSPAGKVYHYSNVSEEIWDDIENPKNGMSIGQAFSQIIKANPHKYPYSCIDEGLGADESESVSSMTTEEPVAPSSPAEILPPELPDDEDGLKSRAMSARTEVTAFTISTAEECELAMREVLRVRAERKAAIEKVNKIKIPATQAWKAACELFNEVDGRYAEAEKYLDGAILAYRDAERRRAAAAAEAERKRREAEQQEAIRQQKAEYERLQAEAQAEARKRAEDLAISDAEAAEAAGAPDEVVQAILENPLPVAAQHVAPPPIAPMATASPIAQQNIPRVQGMSFTTEWFYQITNESEIPFTHEFYSLDLKKINDRVQSLKKHANIPGVFVDSREVPIKRVGKRA
jgi:KTSC domain